GKAIITVSRRGNVAINPIHAGCGTGGITGEISYGPRTLLSGRKKPRRGSTASGLSFGDGPHARGTRPRDAPQSLDKRRVDSVRRPPGGPAAGGRPFESSPKNFTQGYFEGGPAVRYRASGGDTLHRTRGEPRGRRIEDDVPWQSEDCTGRASGRLPRCWGGNREAGARRETTPTCTTGSVKASFVTSGTISGKEIHGRTKACR